MNCPSCGLTIPDDANFCNHCGNPVNMQGKVSGTRAQPPTEPETPANYIMPPPDQGQERVLWDEYPSMRTAIPGIIAWVLGGLAIILAIFFLAPGLEGPIAMGISAVVGIIVLAVLARYFIRLHSTKYRLSTQRMFVTYGLFNKRTDEVELEKYKDIFVNQDFWDKLVGCGDIEVVTSDTTNPAVKIVDVVDPIAKKESIRAAARERKSALGITRREEL